MFISPQEVCFHALLSRLVNTGIPSIMIMMPTAFGPHSHSLHFHSPHKLNVFNSNTDSHVVQEHLEN